MSTETPRDDELFTSMSEVIRELFPYALVDEEPKQPSPWDDPEAVPDE